MNSLLDIIEDYAEQRTVLCQIAPKLPGDGFFELRPYQTATVESIFESLNSYQSTLAVLATGLGKTVCIADLCLRWPDHLGRILVLAHREELIDQAVEKLSVHLGETPAVEMGVRREAVDGHGLLDKSKVLVASVQTMMRDRRQQKFDPSHFGLVIIDEAHHSPAASYRNVIEYFLQNEQVRIVGFTATPERHDEAAMGDIFHDVAFDMDIRDGIDEGWLVPIEQKTVVIEGLDFSQVRTTAGDLNGRDLAVQMMGGVAEKLDEEAQAEFDVELVKQQEKMLHAVVSPTIAEAKGRPTLIFAVTKAHAERLCEICRRHPGVTAEYVTDDTPKDERREIFARFRSGVTQILCGVGIFTEGFDSRADVVAIARPTKSKALYIQMIGRGTRPLPNLVDRYPSADDRREAIANSAKPHMTVLDFVGVSGRHNLISAVDILGGNYTQDVIEAAKLRLRTTGAAEVIDDVLADEAQRIEEARIAAEERRKKWAREEQERKEAARAKAEQERLKRLAEAAKRDHIRGHATYRTESINPFTGQAIPEQVGVGKFRGGATDGQVKLLMRLGVSEETACGYTKGQAGKVITEIKSRTGGDYVMPFGKYHGAKLKFIPADYIDWCVKNMGDQEVLANIKKMRDGATEASTPL